MTQEEKKDYLHRVFRAAVGAGICGSVKDFADALGVNRSGLSSAMNGSEKALTNSLVKKVRDWSVSNGLGEDTPTRTPAPPVTIPGETMRLFETMAETARSQQETIKEQNATISQLVNAITSGAGISALAGSMYAPKNFQTDGK